jgi:hypothetical protein
MNELMREDSTSGGFARPVLSAVEYEILAKRKGSRIETVGGTRCLSVVADAYRFK